MVFLKAQKRGGVIYDRRKNKELKNPPIYPLESYQQAKPEDFINYWQKILPSGKKKFTPSELMKVENGKGITNLDIIWGTYDKEEQVKYKSDYDSGTLPYIKQGTVLWCPKEIHLFLL